MNINKLKVELDLAKKLNTKLIKESLANQRKSQNLIQLLIKKQEDSRREISRELHDEIAQLLTGINFELSVLSKETDRYGERLIDKIAKTQVLVRDSVEVIHRYARELRPLILDDLGLVPALKSYIKEFVKQNTIEVEFKTPHSITNCNYYSKTVLFRVAQEAMTNIAKHSKATRVTIKLQKLKNTVKLEIADNGQSFKLKAHSVSLKHKGMGLLIMEERVKMVGGKFVILAAPKKGTKVTATIPCNKDKFQ